MYRRAANGSVVDRYGGNIRLAQAVAGMYNFSIRFIEPPPGELWGELTSNGTWNGMVGLFAREEGDIGVANLFITALGGRRKFQEYTFPYGQESTCFLIRRGAGLPRWQSLALPFAQDTWLAVLLVALLVGPVLYVLSQPQVTSGEKLAGRSFAFSTLYTFAVHLRNSRPLLPLRTSLQVFVAFLWVYVIIVTEAYSANLTAFLTVERVPEGINTLKELYQSSFTVYAQGPFFGNNLAAAKNEHARGLSDRFIPLPDLESILEHVVSGEGVYIASINNLIYTISLHTTPQGSPTLRVIKECFQPFNMAMGLQSHSPLKRNLDQAVRMIVEAGLVHHWLDETLLLAKQDRQKAAEWSASTSTEGSANTTDRKIEQSVPLSLEHLQGVFIVLVIGCSVSLFVFFVEVVFRDSWKR
ncbi:ionotropic receptor 21a-like [Scylla paramamosain]|uniref:ionotropic receptor 21a-like n=1 Tax=Scylla paramamosain TaxID=85552 RepID=UPI00308270F2